ncbi:anti-sigma factor, partial [Pseudomonas fluorescens]
MNEINCTVCHELIHGYLDHELDATITANVAEHLSQCADCQRVHNEMQRLITSVKAHAPYYAAPDALIQQVFANLPSP